MSVRELTKAQHKALTILAEAEDITPRQFAREMWPDSPGWKRSHKCGPYGASRGAMMPMAGGGYLGKLSRVADPPWVIMVSRWVCGRYLGHNWAITQAGRDVLARHNERYNSE